MAGLLLAAVLLAIPASRFRAGAAPAPDATYAGTTNEGAPVRITTGPQDAPGVHFEVGSCDSTVVIDFIQYDPATRRLERMQYGWRDDNTMDVTGLISDYGVAVGVSADGTSIDQIVLTVALTSCQEPSVTLNLGTQPIINGRYFRGGQRLAGQYGKYSIVGAMLDDHTMGGGFIVPGPACDDVAGEWIASTTAARPTPPAPSGAITGAIPPNGGIGLIVYQGGSTQQIFAASGCPRSSSVFWADDGAGGFVAYVPGTNIAAVNAPWYARFPGDIPPNTVIVGRCG
jgi:hypothetical protein